MVPRAIPAPEERAIRFAEVRHSEGILVPKAFPTGKTALTVPANGKASFLLDQRELTMGYPVLIASGGRGASATLTHAEGLYDAQNHKGNRDDIAGKTIKGLKDRISFDGGDARRFQSLWLRTWRYVQVDIQTADEPLRLDDIHFHGLSIPAACLLRQRPALDRRHLEDRLARLSPECVRDLLGHPLL